jgi:hypothetical protein
VGRTVIAEAVKSKIEAVKVNLISTNTIVEAYIIALLCSIYSNELHV